MQYRFKKLFTIVCLLFFTVSFGVVSAQQSPAPLRRPISPEQPMWLIHIDTWNYPDPQKIIDLIPKDIRPYVVMNISLSISHNVETSRFQVAEYGYEIARSWLRTCAQNQMWATVQLASGGYAQFSDSDLSVYEEFYRDFPNLIGFNYAEQFWGFDDANDPLSPKWTDRMAHFANLLKLSNKYGGYLVVSWCGNQWSPAINPIGMMKRSPDFAAACEKYTENYLLFEKYTQVSYQSDMESICLGAYLSGYSGNYGIRYDETGWTDSNGENKNFTLATGSSVHLEHSMLTGSTMIDGPEIIWFQCFRETGRKATTDGYSMRDWETLPQFINVSVDHFRKILDGTVRIPTKQEVIERTKMVIINDVNTGTSNDIYSSPQTLFEGLYRMEDDGNYENNKTFFKKTGRYPTIPTVFKLDEEASQAFEHKINRSAFAGRWPTVNSKVAEFNNLFPEEYTGDLYAGRHENGWVIYNPFKTGQTASASIPFKYNTCDHVDLTYSQYTASVMKETPGKLTFYLSNYDNVIHTGLKTNVIKIYGSTSAPTFSFQDRGLHQASSVTAAWSAGVYTLTVMHNGPIDIAVNCSGTATGRLTAYTQATLVEPVKPPVYTGDRQYEAECFDYKSISGITTGGQNGTIRNYSGQGYLRMGTNALAAVRDTVVALRSGVYQLITKYAVAGGDVSSFDLYVNGVKLATPLFTKTANESAWNHLVQSVELTAGKNVIVYKANGSASYSLLLDHMVITQGSNNGVYHFENDTETSEASTPPAELITIRSGSAGVVSYIDEKGQTGNGFKAYAVGNTNQTGVADLELFPTASNNYTIVWKEFYTITGAQKGILLRGSGDRGSCSYAEGMKQGYLFTAINNEDHTITLQTYRAEPTGLTSKTSYTSSFVVQPGKATHLRASAYNDQLKFECSDDGINWEGGSTTVFIDDRYKVGSTHIVWGLKSNNLGWVMDNISYLQAHIAVSKLNVNELDYTQGNGPSTGRAFSVSGSKFAGSLVIQAPDDFEVSLSASTGYAPTLTILPNQGELVNAGVFVRLKAGLTIGSYDDEITIRSDLLSGPDAIGIKVSGRVTPSAVSRIYDFSHDLATTAPQSVPALYASVGAGNTATAGVVSFTDSRQQSSNMLKPYAGGQRNATGVINLDRFSKNATDYSVTWKQCVGSGSDDYKVGVLLRGDVHKVGDAAGGYVQGMMHGYLFIAYTANGGTTKHSEFRIYRSTEAFNALSMMVNSSVNTLIPLARQPVWYRASVSGSSPVSLKLEYSTDSISWNAGAVSSDPGLAAFPSGATQMVWGLGAANINFQVDDITFDGIESANGALADAIWVSQPSINGLEYLQNAGPSESKSFTVSGTSLMDDLHLFAPPHYEISTSLTSGYSSYLALAHHNGSVETTVVFTRLKSGLKIGSYNGEVEVSSIGVLTKSISLNGVVASFPTGVKNQASVATILSSTYYTLTGQRIQNKPLTNGIYIVRSRMSDNTTTVSKEYFIMNYDK